MSNKATDNLLRAIQSYIRIQMNDAVDAMASGVCEDYAAYKQLCGVVEGLARAERTILDFDERASQD